MVILGHIRGTRGSTSEMPLFGKTNHPRRPRVLPRGSRDLGGGASLRTTKETRMGENLREPPTGVTIFKGVLPPRDVSSSHQEHGERPDERKKKEHKTDVEQIKEATSKIGGAISATVGLFRA